MPVSSFVISTDAPLTELLCASATLSLSVASVTWAIAVIEKTDARQKIRMRRNSLVVRLELALCERGEKEPKRRRLRRAPATPPSAENFSKVSLLKQGKCWISPA